MNLLLLCTVQVVVTVYVVTWKEGWHKIPRELKMPRVEKILSTSGGTEEPLRHLYTAQLEANSPEDPV